MIFSIAEAKNVHPKEEVKFVELDESEFTTEAETVIVSPRNEDPLKEKQESGSLILHLISSIICNPFR